MQNTWLFKSCKIPISFNLNLLEQYLRNFLKTFDAKDFILRLISSKVDATLTQTFSQKSINSKLYQAGWRDWSNLGCTFLANIGPSESSRVWSWLKHIHILTILATLYWKDWLTLATFLWMRLNAFVGANKISLIWVCQKKLSIFIFFLWFKTLLHLKDFTLYIFGFNS